MEEIPTDQPHTLTSPSIEEKLNSISSYFTVGPTEYGGRGCFARSAIPKGTQIHYCTSPVGSSIAKPFRKEVCTYCFNYYNGDSMKTKLTKAITGKKESSPLYFCSKECLDSFVDQDIDDILLTNLLLVEQNYSTGLKKPEVDALEPVGNLDKQIDREWERVDQWAARMDSTRGSKRINFLPRIDESEYLEIKYIVNVLFNKFKLMRQHDNENDQGVSLGMEMFLFDLLQSTEREKYHKYPYLLFSYMNIFKFIKLTCTAELQQFITTDSIRDLIGKNLSNAFGIWSNTTSKDEDKEFLGFSVYPSASFFNHSCAPNIIKIRIRNDMRFETLRDIAPGEELCINYGNFQNENVDKRQLELQEWFFNCGCTKCQMELDSYVKS
ncbi:SET6 [Candida margitis]|uniref:SET6 n=1 Tax=Candida margitis TaxID=1775924 RepID=UPI00222723EB|nr:SET6 [Candida margitis]KAI5953012.1 SET6 [Candida margitis]